MKMILFKYFLLFGQLLIIYIVLSKLFYAAERRSIVYSTQMVNVTVVNTPLCNKNSSVDVELNGKLYSMSIKNYDCYDGIYRVGKQVQVPYSPELDEINPTNYEGAYRFYIGALVIFVIFLIIYIYYGLIKGQWKEYK
jgi:hypothetical protein